MSAFSALAAATLQGSDKLVHQPRLVPLLNAMAARLERQLSAEPSRLLVREPVDSSVSAMPAPHSVRPSWMFVLRANAVSGAECHQNCIQSVMSWRRAGDLQTERDGEWISPPWSVVRTNFWNEGGLPFRRAFVARESWESKTGSSCRFTRSAPVT